MSDLLLRLRTALAPVIVGQDGALREVTAALLCGGHALIEGPPGTAKTLLARALAAALGLDFTRAQFTPDMLPSDLTGTMILRGAELSFRPGPVFTNVLLADEINRTPPKTQAALLEAMGEGQVTVDGTARELPDPFLVLATQNPIEYEGTYPLPEAQLDRFLLKVQMDYPSAEEERALLGLPRRGLSPVGLERVRPVTDATELRRAREAVDSVSATNEVTAYTVELIRRTRALPSVVLGASPRAAVHLLAAARATAWLDGRTFVTPDDVAGIAPAVLGHRLILTPEAELERSTAKAAVAAVLAELPVPR